MSSAQVIPQFESVSPPPPPLVVVVVVVIVLCVF